MNIVKQCISKKFDLTSRMLQHTFSKVCCNILWVMDVLQWGPTLEPSFDSIKVIVVGFIIHVFFIVFSNVL